MKKLKSHLFLILGILITIVLLLNKLIVYAIIAIAITCLINYIFKSIISKFITKLNKAEDAVFQLNEELNNIKSSKINVLGIKEILEIGLLEINTKLTRVWNDKMKKENKTLNFIGALDVNLIAKYGLDLTKVKIKETQNEIFISNTKPHLISFSDLEYSWKISEVLELKKPLIGKNFWRKSDDLNDYCTDIKNEYQKDIHKQIKKGPAELEWIINPLHSKIKSFLSLKYSKKTITFVENDDDTFVKISIE